MNSILITGGAGYLGSKLVPQLLKDGYKVKVYDLLIYGKKVLQDHDNLEIIKGDIRNLSLLENCLDNIDIVIHLACISNDPSFELNPLLGKTINLDPFEPMVKLSLKKGVKKFIYASSSSVYGIKKEKHVTEDLDLVPISTYNKTKMVAERILLSYSNYIENFIIRPATVCGISPRMRFDVSVNMLTLHALKKKKITSIFY